MEVDELNDSYKYLEDEFLDNNLEENSSFAPSKEYIMIFTFFAILVIVIIEKIYVSIFLYFIPSYFFLIVSMIILNIILIRYILISSIFLGRNKIINFSFRSFIAKKKVRFLIYYINIFNEELDNILSNKISEDKNRTKIILKSRIIQKYIDIYENVQKNYGSLSTYSKNFYDHLLLLKNKIENSSLKDIINKIEQNEDIIINDKDANDFHSIKKETEEIKTLLNEFIDSKTFLTNLKNVKEIFYNDIFQSKEFIRESILYLLPNSQNILVQSKGGAKLDCLLVSLGNNKEGVKSKNLIIVCGPNLIPFENLITTWKIDKLYLKNNINLLFWNYRGYGFSEGNADFDNIGDDILSIYDYISSNYSFSKIGVYGFSIGGIAACHLANNRSINLLVADRTFGSFQGILDQFYFGKYSLYLSKIFFITLIDNTNNYLSAKCNKIILNDVQDTIILDSVSLKSEISKQIIFKIFNETNPEFNTQKISSYNILDYALGREQSRQMYQAFSYTILFLKNNNKNKNKVSDMNFINEEGLDNDMNQRLNYENKDGNIDVNAKDALNILYEKLRLLYYDFFVKDNSFEGFLEHNCKKINFNNFFNCLVVFGSEDISLKDYFICNIKYTENELNDFITEIDKILNLEEIRKISDNILYQKLTDLNEGLKSLKTFIAGLGLEEIDNKWMKQMKGILIPLTCGHTSFYHESKTINTLIYLIRETFNSNESIDIDPLLIENNQ